MVRSVHPQSEKNFGDPIKYDPDFHGPLNKRSCTDIICLFLFVIFIVCWIAIGVFAMTHGDKELFLVPKDSKDQRCGHDSQVRDKPYLYFIDITKCVGVDTAINGCKTPQICVAKCPSSEYVHDGNGNFNDERSKIMCDYDISPTSQDELNKYIADGKCSKWYLPSTPIFKRCLPKELSDLPSAINFTVSQLQEATKNIKYLAAAEEVVTLVTEDIIQSWWKILLGLLGAIVVCLMYIILMRWIAGVMVWISIIGVIVLLSVGVYFTATKYKTLLDAKETKANSDSLWEQKSVWLVLLIIVSALLLISLLIIIFLRKRILIAIALIREGSKAVSAVTTTLVFPIVPWILQILVIVYAIFVALYLSSIGEPTYKATNVTESCNLGGLRSGDSCDPKNFNYNFGKTLRSGICSNTACILEEIKKPEYVKIMHAFNVIGAFWSVFFFSAFGEMVLAATFATWYWTFRKSDLPFLTLTNSLLRTLRYHVGTLAFGSLIITICRLIRVAIEYIDHKLKKYDNPCVRGVMCCCKCFFWCLEKFLKFINKNAYIMCAIHGKNFCTSAKDAFNLLMRNLLRVFVVDKVTDMLFFLAKLLVTMTVAVVAYTAFTNADFNVVDIKDLHYALVPVIVIAIGTYFISSVFFGVYSMAVDTLFLCFLEDCERNDGSPEKPYYMSKDLMKILGKKNKKLQ